MSQRVKEYKEYTAPNYSPLHDRVLIVELPEEEITKGGIIIPDTAREKSQKGVVVATGAGLDRPLTVKPGDLVNYSKYAGSELKIDGVDYRIMRETDVFGAFTNPDVLPIIINQEPAAIPAHVDTRASAVPAPDVASNDEGADVLTPQAFFQQQTKRSKK